MKPFSIVFFSSAPPRRLQHVLRRLQTDLPEVQVAGVLYERRPHTLTPSKRLKRFWSLMPDADFRAYVFHRFFDRARTSLSNVLDRLIRIVHCCPENPNGEPLTVEALARDCESRNIAFWITPDIHAPESLAFVRQLRPDLGLIVSTRILKPELFTIPDRGSINIHKHKVPEYRGGGAPGIWEMRDDKTEATVTIHRVLTAVDAGNVLGERTFSIDRFDTLTSAGFKADLVAVDLLIDVLRRECAGTATERPQTSKGTVYKGYKDHEIFAIERSICAKRRPYTPQRSRPLYKLLPRFLAYPALFLRNLRRRRKKQFPVTILFHHLITDKPKYMGLPTEQFAKQVQFLKKHYKVASLPEAIEMLRKNEVPVPTVVLTFDDGYAENFLCLRAVAEAERIPVTLFVCTQAVSEQRTFKHDTDRGEEGFKALSWDQVRYFDRHNAVIGSHTRTHFDCGAEDEDVLLREIEGSRQDLVENLGHDVPFFSFPKGEPQNMSSTAVHVAAKIYPYIFSACGGTNGELTTPAHLRRCSHPDSILDLELLLQGILEFGPAVQLDLTDVEHNFSDPISKSYSPSPVSQPVE